MPQRNTIRRVPTPEVQGDDSWVEVRAVTVGDMMHVYERQEQMRRPSYRVGSFLARAWGWLRRLFRRKPPEPLQSDTYREYCYGVIRQVSAWNWVDADGEPLPQPAESPRVVERLTDPEVVCLMRAVYGEPKSDEENLKN
jgi:hypothetical protein